MSDLLMAEFRPKPCPLSNYLIRPQDKVQADWFKMLQARIPHHKMPRNMLKAINLLGPHHITRKDFPTEPTPEQGSAMFGVEGGDGLVDGG